MKKEFQNLLDIDTWELVPCPSVSDPISCKWVLKTKLKSNGKLDKYKARLMVKATIKMRVYFF